MPAPSALLCATFCSMASHRESVFLQALSADERRVHRQREKQLKDAGWIPLSTSEELGISSVQHGYFGVAYYHPRTQRVIFAHRGTCFSKTGNLLADIEIAEQKHPRILEDVNRYVSQVLRLQKARKVKVSELIHTGFSLGGFIAGAKAGLSVSKKVSAVVFDAPGIGHLENVAPDAATRITHYVTRPNLVNTCNSHVGPVIQLMAFVDPRQKERVDFKLDLTNLGLAPPARLDSSWTVEEMRADAAKRAAAKKAALSVQCGMQELAETLDSHNLDRVITALENSSPRQMVYLWPTATNEFLYGPEQPVQLYQVGNWGSTLGFLLNIAALSIQGAKEIAAKLLWSLTAYYPPDSRELHGMIGMIHQRENRVYYSQEDYLKHLALLTIQALLLLAQAVAAERAEANEQVAAAPVLPHAPNHQTALRF